MASNVDMDDIGRCLDLTPALADCKRNPTVNAQLSIFKRSIWASTEQIEQPKAHLIVLCECIAHVICALWDRPVQVGKDDALAVFTSFVQDVSGYVQKSAQRSTNFVRTLLSREESTKVIDGYIERFVQIFTSLQLQHTDDIDRRHWRRRGRIAKAQDQAGWDTTYQELEASQQRLEAAFELEKNDPVSMTVAFQRRMEHNNVGEIEKLFLAHCLRHLSNFTGEEVHLDSWTVTSFDVEFGKKIGTGGFGIVYQGKWNGRQVAVKTLNTDKHVAPRIAAVRREVQTWSKLNHPHVLEFLGANILDEKPFMVMPLLTNGNALDYIQKNPDFPRLPIIHHISLGLAYLHSQSIVHGDLKGSNVLIDGNFNAVLCDFGLSRLKADVNTRTQDDSAIFVGSQNWMAPELFQGGSLRFPCDIYSFGMTVFEIFTTETPLGTVPTMEALRKLVVEKDVRPDRPEDQEAPQLTPAIWKLARQCWVKDPSARPPAVVVSKRLNELSLLSHPPRSPPGEEETQQDRQREDQKKGDSDPYASPVLRRKPSLMQKMHMFKHRRAASEPNAEPHREPDMGMGTTRSRQKLSLRLFRRMSTVDEGKIEESLPFVFVFGTPYDRCMTLDHKRNTTVLSLSNGGRYLAVGLEVNHAEIWDIHVGTKRGPKRIVSEGQPQPQFQYPDGIPDEPIVALDFQDTFAGRFLITATQSRIRVRQCIDIMRNHATEWEDRQAYGAPDILDVQFQGGGFCDSVAVVDAEHRIRRGTKSAVKDHDQTTYQLGGLVPIERTCFLWPRDSKSMFVGVAGGDILVYDAVTGQEQIKTLTFGDVQLERSGVATLVDGPSARATHPGTLQDGLADAPLDASTSKHTPITAECRTLAYHPTTKKLVACYNTGEIRVWDVRERSYQVLREAQKNNPFIYEDLFVIACSPKESFVVYPSLEIEKTLLFQDINTKAILAFVYLPESPPATRMKSIIVSPDQKRRRLVISFEDCPAVKVWCWD